MPGLWGTDLCTKYLVRALLDPGTRRPRHGNVFFSGWFAVSRHHLLNLKKSLAIRWWKACVEETLLSFKQTVHEVEALCSWLSLCLSNGHGSLPNQQCLPPHGVVQAYRGCGSPCLLPHISPAKKTSIYRTHHTNSLLGLLKTNKILKPQASCGLCGFVKSQTVNQNNF